MYMWKVKKINKQSTMMVENIFNFCVPVMFWGCIEYSVRINWRINFIMWLIWNIM